MFLRSSLVLQLEHHAVFSFVNVTTWDDCFEYGNTVLHATHSNVLTAGDLRFFLVVVLGGMAILVFYHEILLNVEFL